MISDEFEDEVKCCLSGFPVRKNCSVRALKWTNPNIGLKNIRFPDSG